MDGEKKIISQTIENEMQRSYIDYSMSVIVGRALPDVRDGLKPVHRKILFAMDNLSLTYNRPHKKSATVVGEVLGKYHPHGDSAAYEAMVRMAQPFSLRYPLVDGQGNFGSVDGDSAAAMRYTEARMTKMASDLKADLDKNTVDMMDNYDGSLKEPVVLPSKFPNLLVNGSDGIAVGMATKMPPHNLREVCGAIAHTIDNPEATTEELMQFVEKYFPKVELDDSTTDIFGRWTNTWKNGKKTIGSYVKTPDALYHADVKEKTIYADLDLDDPYTFDIIVDGEDNDETFAVVYRRNDGGYGLIEDVE